MLHALHFLRVGRARTLPRTAKSTPGARILHGLDINIVCLRHLSRRHQRHDIKQRWKASSINDGDVSPSSLPPSVGVGSGFAERSALHQTRLGGTGLGGDISVPLPRCAADHALLCSYGSSDIFPNKRLLNATRRCCRERRITAGGGARGTIVRISHAASPRLYFPAGTTALGGNAPATRNMQTYLSAALAAQSKCNNACHHACGAGAAARNRAYMAKNFACLGV